MEGEANTRACRINIKIRINRYSTGEEQRSRRWSGNRTGAGLHYTHLLCAELRSADVAHKLPTTSCLPLLQTIHNRCRQSLPAAVAPSLRPLPCSFRVSTLPSSRSGTQKPPFPSSRSGTPHIPHPLGSRSGTPHFPHPTQFEKWDPRSSLFDLRLINVSNEWISGLDGPELVSGIPNDLGRPNTDKKKRKVKKENCLEIGRIFKGKHIEFKGFLFIYSQIW